MRLLIFGDVGHLISFPIELWFFQILIILFPMLLFQSYFRKKLRSIKQRSWVFGILCGLSILLCMSAPVSIQNGYILDFRYIPLILAFLYGGYRLGLMLSLMIIAYRLTIIGLEGAYFVLIVSVFLLTVFYVTLHKYKNFSYKGKVVYAVWLLFFTILIFAFGSQSLNDFSGWRTGLGMWATFLFLNTITLFTTIYINESLSEMEIIHYEIAEFEKMHLISQFSIGFAQQIQQPLSKIEEILNTVKNESLSNQGRYQLSLGLSEIVQSKKILSDYLSLTSNNENENNLLNIHDEFDYVFKCIQSYALIHQVELNFIPSFDKELYIKGNRNQFHQALLNFMKNGIESIKQNGKLEIAIHEMLESIYIVIEDNGNGMSKEQINRLGNPVKSYKENGTGLGTMIAYNIIHSMSGKIDVSSEKGKGTTFSIIFPKAKRV